MEYVMVPVPEQYVAEAERFIRWQGLDQDPPTEAAALSLRGLFDLLDADSQRLLLAVVHAAQEGERTTIEAMADAVGCEPRAAIGMMVEMNSVSASSGGSPFVLALDKNDDAAEGEPFARSFSFLTQPWVAAAVTQETGDSTSAPT